MRPTVTIGICVKNCEASLKEAIDSVLNQNFSHELMEVIFVDDGSEDGTFSVIQKYIMRMDVKVKVFRNKWMGLGAARNIVVDNAKSDYIVWVDGDIVLPTDHVRKQVEYMEKNPMVGIAKAKYGAFPEENLIATLENIPFLVDDIHSGNEWKTASKLPGTGGSIYRVEAINQVGGFDYHLKGTGEDQDAAFRIKEAGWSICRTNAVFYEQRSKTWKAIWEKYVWYGHGDYDLYLKNRRIFSLLKMTPFAGFIAGVLYAIPAYRLLRRKVVFLLPIHFTFKMTAWCLGFLIGYLGK
ncbi:glycosyltransferase [Candidatus Bathyarchaeota archaeon]|nr:glycosyltransferase [Candidatus Bathyarchaeota archaeon]